MIVFQVLEEVDLDDDGSLSYLEFEHVISRVTGFEKLSLFRFSFLNWVFILWDCWWQNSTNQGLSNDPVLKSIYIFETPKYKCQYMYIYTLFHEFFSTFFGNKISLPERRNKRKSVLEITKMYYV